jgi:hypothetical protein
MSSIIVLEIVITELKATQMVLLMVELGLVHWHPLYLFLKALIKVALPLGYRHLNYNDRLLYLRLYLPLDLLLKTLY